MKVDKQEFVKLIDTHQGIIHKVCSMYRQTGTERVDLFQEIVLQLWKGYPSFKGEAKLTTWMYRVALNTAISQFRKTKRRPRVEELSEYAYQLPDHPIDYEKKEKSEFLQRAIQKLSEIEKAVIMLYLESHSYDEIAQIMGMTKTHVGVKINRIKKKLRDMLIPHFS